uniref:E3 ubiquitin-protein ligase RNF6/12 N-terminal domain-containing protein n=1 Tax=Knipowitschia caucasica TaxID=637954 RepID=A0AAV2LCA6_KNICA
MRDSNLLGTPGEVTAEELRQRLDGAKERVSSQPPLEHPAQTAGSGDQQAVSDVEERLPNGRRQPGNAEPGGEPSNGDSLLEWLNTFRQHRIYSHFICLFYPSAFSSIQASPISHPTSTA